MSVLNNRSILIDHPGLHYIVSGQTIELEQRNSSRSLRTETRSTIRFRFYEAEKAIEAVWRETQPEPGVQDAVSITTKINASDFLRALPLDIRSPEEVDVLPNGQISITWQSDLGDMTVIVREHEVHFGQRLNNGDRYSGSTKWAGRVGRDIVDRIRQVIA